MQLIAYCLAIGAFACAVYWYRHTQQLLASREVDINSSTAQLAGITDKAGVVDYEQRQATVHADHYQRVVKAVRDSLIASKPFTVDYRVNVGDGGKPRWVRSYGMPVVDSDGQRFSELGFAGYLPKPISQRDLIDCLSVVLTAEAECWHDKSKQMVTRHELRAQRQHRYRSLLAEDNPVNQKMACRQLERLGYFCGNSAASLRSVSDGLIQNTL